MHNNHLSDEAISLYAEGLKLDKLDKLPESINEHIESCDQCHAQAIELYSLIKDIDQGGPHPYFDKAPAKVFPLKTLASLAATFLVGGLLFFFLLKNQAKIDENPNHQLVEDSLKVEQSMKQEDTLEIKPIEEVLEKKPRPIAMAYTPNEELEGLTARVYRSSDFEIESPKNGVDFKSDTAIPFQWQGNNDQKYLIILDNKGKQINRRLLNVNKLDFKENLAPGLYYWKLETEEDLLHVGKFTINK